MDTQKLISIVIPIYNVEKYLRQCVDSVLAQTYTNLEIILVDDGSPDGCGAICDEYAWKDRRITVIHKHNGGLSDARNAGFSACNGDYVYFLDSDDTIAETAIDELYHAAEGAGADFVFFDAVSVYENNAGEGSHKADWYIRKHSYQQDKGYKVLRKLREHSEYRSAVPLTFISTQFIRRYALAFYKGILHEDELYTFLLFLHARCAVHLPRTLYYRLERANSIMSVRKTSRNFEGYCTVFWEILRLYTDGDFESEVKELIRRWAMHMLTTALTLYHKLDATERKESVTNRRAILRAAHSFRYFGSRKIYVLCLNHTLYPLAIWTLGSLSKAKKLFSLILKSPKGVLYSDHNRRLSRLLKTSDHKQRILLIGTPEHGNLGDHAIAIAEKKLLQVYRPDLSVVEIPMPVYRQSSEKLFRCVQPEDIIAISGGGWLGTLWQHNEDTAREIIERCPRSRIIVFPQTVYYEADENGQVELLKAKSIYPRHEDLIFCLRDRASYDFVLTNGLISHSENCILAPDMVLFLNYSNLSFVREGVLLCFRRDCEKTTPDSFVQDCITYLNEGNIPFRRSSTNLHRGVNLAERESAFVHKLVEFASSRLVITDRLHCMLFAAITGTPCIAMDNLTGKVAGVYQWIKELQYVRFAETPEKALSLIPELIGMDHCRFTNDSLTAFFSELAQRI